MVCAQAKIFVLDLDVTVGEIDVSFLALLIRFKPHAEGT
jgi:hypothetical protein